MEIKRVTEASNAIDVDFDVVDITEDMFHDLLSNVGRLGDAHW